MTLPVQQLTKGTGTKAMTTLTCKFKTTNNRAIKLPIAICCLFIISWLIPSTSDCAAVVSRNQRRSSATSRVPTMTAQLNLATTPPVQPATPTPTPAPSSGDTGPTNTTPDTPSDSGTTTETTPEPTPIQNKSSSFSELLTVTASSATPDRSANTLAELIRAQRAALDAADSASTAGTGTGTTKQLVSGRNLCDANLRACMMEKCGKDFSKCALDTDTLWGTKMDACRRDLPCTGTEYSMFAAQIKADRDLNATISSYNQIIDCGNSYNDCIIRECGQKFGKCLGKAAGDAAISKCDKIAKSCIEMDSGLASRAMSAFGDLRVDAEKQIARDEERLYTLRDGMRSACERLGAMFDERTLDCVYTINFYAGDDNTLFASKKAYAGSTFDCTQNWFGIDITTFRENAYRLTREQSSATSSLMGSGLGMGIGAITSGAIDRAIDRHTAERALDRAQDEHDELYGDNDDGKKDDENSNGKKNKGKKKDVKENKDNAAVQEVTTDDAPGDDVGPDENPDLTETTATVQKKTSQEKLNASPEDPEITSGGDEEADQPGPED